MLLTVKGSSVSCAARKKLTAAAHGWLALKSSQYIPQCRSLAILQRPPPGFFLSRLPLCVWLPRFRLTVLAKVTMQMKNTGSQLWAPKIVDASQPSQNQKFYLKKNHLCLYDQAGLLFLLTSEERETSTVFVSQINIKI